MEPARPKTGVVGFRRLPAVGLLFCLLTPILHAESRVLTDLSLEELANIRLTATSVMGIHHTHPKGEWMVSYTRMQSRMAGNRSGTARLSDNEVLNDFMVAPTSMDMDMHMVGIMGTPTDNLTIMAMVPFMEMSMEHVTRGGKRFTTQSSGIGDVSVSGLYTVYKREGSLIHLHLGGSLPTGSIDARGDTPAGRDLRLPYPMQLGSGTFNLDPGVAYLVQNGRWNMGGHLGSSIPVGTNDNGYRLGRRAKLDAWVTRRWNDWFSSSFRTVASSWGDIEGADPLLNAAMVPTAVPDFRGGNRVELRVGLNFYVAEGEFARNRFSIEVAQPIRQSLHGPQLQQSFSLNIGWQYAWRFSR